MSPLTPAQQEIVANLDTNFCVTSGAGCGKTRVLVERYIRFLEQDLTLPLQRLAAITFTENAAAEMRGRIRDACRERFTQARRDGDTRSMEVWRGRYYDVDVAPIDTIHSFCAGLLRQHPIEAGVDPNFSLLDEADAAFLRKDVVAASLEKLLEADDADLLAVLAHHDLAPARDMLIEVLQEKREVLQRVAAPVMARSDDEILRDLRQAIGERTMASIRQWAALDAVKSAARVLGENEGAESDKREVLRREALARLDRIASARTADIAREAVVWLAGGINLTGGSAKSWPSKEACDAVKGALKTLRDTAVKVLKSLPAYDEEVERRHLGVARAFYRTAGRVIENYEAAKRERSALDFEDLQMLARDLLRSHEHPQVLLDCRKRFRAILVDELQDTNLLQFQIVDLLVSGEAVRGKAAPLRPGAFFGVGDPKQSIYRFRGAEFEVFRTALGRVEDGGRKGLMESFRLHTGLAGLVNHLFGRLMGDLYEPIRGMREQKNATVGEFLIVRSPGEPLNSAAGQAQEAALAASRIREIVESGAVLVRDDDAPGGHRPARYGDVAILMRRMSNLHVYEEALERRGVPYYVVSGGGFYKQQEVLDVIHLLRVLDDPTDDLHLAGVLRSPFFAVSDEGLYHLRQEGGTLHEALAAAARADHLDAEDRRAIGRAAGRLPQWAAAKDRLGLGTLVDRVVFDSGYAASAVGRFGGARAYANLRQMAELARSFERHGLHALGDYIEYVTDFMQSEMREEQASVEALGSDTVRVMTIHKAKGLEFPVVVVPDLGCVPQGAREPFLVHPATGLAMSLRDDSGDRQPSGSLALARCDAADAERDESRRLLYVAVTRAKDYLLFVSHVARNSGDRESWHDSLVQGLGANKESGDTMVQLPRGEVLSLSIRPPQDEAAGKGRRRAGPRDILTAGRVAWNRLRERAETVPPRRISDRLNAISPPRLPDRPPARLTATALSVYQHCPAQYRWSVVLGIDEPQPAEVGPGLSRREFGTICHRAMELAVSPEEASIVAAADAALHQHGAADRPGAADLRRRIEQAVRGFWAGPVGRRLAAARRVHRELPFVLGLDGTEIRGTMDLLFEDADGQWELVDYKTATPSVAPTADLATPYELQLGLYAMAAGQWLGRPPARWSVVFLGADVVAEHAVADADADRTRSVARNHLTGMAAGRFECVARPECNHCRYGRLCRKGPVG